MSFKSYINFLETSTIALYLASIVQFNFPSQFVCSSLILAQMIIIQYTSVLLSTVKYIFLCVIA